MFTGLIENTGRITGIALHGESGKLTVVPDSPFQGLIRGESIAVNGACLTLEEGMNGGPLVFHVLRETLERTNLSTEKAVNLERAMVSGGRFGGHIVQGHVDAASQILSFEKRASDLELVIALPDELAPYIVEKGSVAVDGISLTVEKVLDHAFRIGIIPTTGADTVLLQRKTGSLVNLETDILGKYVVSYLKRNSSSVRELTMETLAGAGFL